MPDLPRRRHQAPGWTRPISDRLTPAIKALVIANSLLFLLYVFVREARAFLQDHVALGPRLWLGELWQPLTALFVHFEALGFIFNLIGLWFVGALIERTTGTRRFLVIFFASGVVANLVVAAVAAVLGRPQIFEGSSFAILALFVAFGRMYGSTQAQIIGGLFLQARTLGLIMVAWALLAYILRGGWPEVAGTLAASAGGFVLAGDAELSALWDRFRAGRIRRRYRVLEGGRGGGKGADKRGFLN